MGRLRAAGLEPLLLPPLEGDTGGLVQRVLGMVDGVVIPGGAFDIHPRHYGQAQTGRLDHVDEGRTALELAFARRAMEQGLPLLGICGGMQVMAVAAGGTLVQDISTEHPGAQEHEQPTDPAQPWHEVRLEAGPLRAALGTTTAVNSTHHQAVLDPGLLTVSGRAPDGVAEAVHHDGHRFCVGVQWHPELLEGPLFRAFAAAVERP